MFKPPQMRLAHKQKEAVAAAEKIVIVHRGGLGASKTAEAGGVAAAIVIESLGRLERFNNANTTASIDVEEPPCAAASVVFPVRSQEAERDLQQPVLLLVGCFRSHLLQQRGCLLRGTVRPQILQVVLVARLLRCFLFLDSRCADEASERG